MVWYTFLIISMVLSPSISFDTQFSIFYFLTYNQKWKVVTKNNMDNPRFVDEETIPLVQDEDYDNYGTPNTSRVDETSFT